MNTETPQTPLVALITLYDYFPPSLNKTQHAHWTTVRKNKMKAIEHVKVACLTQIGRIPMFAGPVKIEITRLYAGRRRPLDPDNLMGSLKPLIDAMRAEKAHGNQNGRGKQGGVGIILDDDPDSMELIPKQEKVRPDEIKGYNLATRIVIGGMAQV